MSVEGCVAFELAGQEVVAGVLPECRRRGSELQVPRRGGDGWHRFTDDMSDDLLRDTAHFGLAALAALKARLEGLEDDDLEDDLCDCCLHAPEVANFTDEIVSAVAGLVDMFTRAARKLGADT